MPNVLSKFFLPSRSFVPPGLTKARIRTVMGGTPILSYGTKNGLNWMRLMSRSNLFSGKTLLNTFFVVSPSPVYADFHNADVKGGGGG